MLHNAQNRTIQVIIDHHESIAAFARDSFAKHGRGLVQIGFPNVSPGETVVGVRIVKYKTLAQLRQVITDHPEDIKIWKVVDSYDPEHQAAVMAAIDCELPVTIKMQLDKPTIVDGGDGAH